MNANLIRRNFFVLKFLELHQLLKDMLYIDFFLIYFENFDMSIVQMWSDEGFVDSK